MKLAITLTVETEASTVHRWLSLDGAALLAAIEDAIADGEAITIKLRVNKEVGLKRAGKEPPMLALFGRNGDGE